MSNTNPAFVMCPTGESPALSPSNSVVCSIDGSATSSMPYLGDSVSYGGTGDPASSFTDGMTLGWSVASVMVAVYVIRRIYR